MLRTKTIKKGRERYAGELGTKESNKPGTEINGIGLRIAPHKKSQRGES